MSERCEFVTDGILYGTLTEGDAEIRYCIDVRSIEAAKFDILAVIRAEADQKLTELVTAAQESKIELGEADDCRIGRIDVG